MKPFNKKWLQRISSEPASRKGISRRTFLARSGVVLGSGALLGLLPLSCVREATMEEKKNFPRPDVQTEYRRTICTHCSVGCGIIAEFQNGVWIGQEPDYESPINLGAHCAKGAAARDHGFGHRRVKFPMKLVNGAWKRLSWDQAINEIGDQLLKIREESGPDALFFCGSSKASNEGAYLQGKFAAFWGTNNVDNQARICHSTTVAGVATTLGYGAMTNSYNDMQQQQGHALSRQQRGRGPPGRHAAHPARQGERLQDDRRGPALHPHGRPCRHLRPAPVRHRYPLYLRTALAHLQERLGGQGVHRQAGLRHGRHPQGGREMAARSGGKRLRRPRETRCT